MRVRPESRLAERSLADVELPIEVGMRVVAIRRGKEWLIDPDGDEMLLPDDVLILRGPAGRHRRAPRARRRAGVAPAAVPTTIPAITDLDRAVDVLVEMKNVSEVAIGLAYSALLFNDQSLAAEVSHLEDRLDEMRERLELWVLRSAAEQVEPSRSAGCCTSVARPRSSATPRSRWCGWSRRARRCTRSSRIALGDSDEVIVRVPSSPGSFLDGRTLAEAQLEIETGYYLLAIRRAGRYVYRPRGPVQLQAGDELIAIGPDEGRDRLAELAATACSRTTPPARSRSSGSSLVPDRPVTAPLTSGETARPRRSSPPSRRRRPVSPRPRCRNASHAGAVNDTGERTSRTLGEIVRANVFTRFNAILGTMLAVIVVVGPIQDATFGVVLVRERR